MHNALQLPMFCFSFSFSFFYQLIRNIREFGAKNYFTDHWTANTIQLFVPIERKLYWSILFQNKSQQRVILYRLLDKYSHLFIYISLKERLRSGQKPIFTFKTKTSEQIAFAVVLYFGKVFVFCRLINKGMLPSLNNCFIKLTKAATGVFYKKSCSYS